MLFPLGRILATPGAMEAIPEAEMIKDIRRHAAGDWGLLNDDDRAINDMAVRERLRILSAYEYAGVRFYVVTESIRDATTVLLAEEY